MLQRGCAQWMGVAGGESPDELSLVGGERVPCSLKPVGGLGERGPVGGEQVIFVHREPIAPRGGGRSSWRAGDGRRRALRRTKLFGKHVPTGALTPHQFAALQVEPYSSRSARAGLQSKLFQTRL
jgi:hypothetical protein